MSEPPPTIESLLDKVIDNTKQVVQFMRTRFLWTWAAISLLALLTCFSLLLATRNAETNLEQTDDIARVANTTADSAKKASDQTTAYLKGEQGIPGVPGANGQDGTPGQPSSEPGPAGPAGSPGAKGDAGQAGANGTAGSTGLSGAAGPIGPVGIAGASGTNGEAGTVGPKGATGDTGPAGSKGDTGPQGPAGATGAQGPPGPAASITTITVAAASANDAAAQKNVAATCTSGKVSGGGYAILPATSQITPTTSSTVGNGWQVTANADPSFVGNWQVLAFATCVVTQ